MKGGDVLYSGAAVQAAVEAAESQRAKQSPASVKSSPAAAQALQADRRPSPGYGFEPSTKPWPPWHFTLQDPPSLLRLQIAMDRSVPL